MYLAPIADFPSPISLLIDFGDGDFLQEDLTIDSSGYANYSITYTEPGYYPMNVRLSNLASQHRIDHAVSLRYCNMRNFCIRVTFAFSVTFGQSQKLKSQIFLCLIDCLYTSCEKRKNIFLQIFYGGW